LSVYTRILSMDRCIYVYELGKIYEKASLNALNMQHNQKKTIILNLIVKSSLWNMDVNLFKLLLGIAYFYSFVYEID